MIYPMLIKYDEEPVQYLEQHHENATNNYNKMMSSEKQEPSLEYTLNSFFCHRKPEEEVREALRQKDLKLQNNKDQPMLDSSQPEYAEQLPCFKSLLEK